MTRVDRWARVGTIADVSAHVRNLQGMVPGHNMRPIWMMIRQTAGRLMENVRR